MQILMQKLVTDGLVENPDAKKGVEPSEPGPEIASTFSLELAKAEVPQNASQTNRILFSQPESPALFQEGTPSVNEFSEIDSLKPSPVEKVGEFGSAFPFEKMRKGPVSVNLQDALPRVQDVSPRDRVPPALLTTKTGNIKALELDALIKSTPTGAALASAPILPNSNKVLDAASVEKTVVAASKIGDVSSPARQTPRQQDKPVLETVPKNQAGKDIGIIKRTVETVEQIGPRALSGTTSVETPLVKANPAPVGTSSEVKSQLPLQSKRPTDAATPVPSALKVKTPEGVKSDTFRSLPRLESVSGDEKFEAVRPMSTEGSTKVPTTTAASDRPVVKDRPTTSSAEILYRPIVIADAKYEQAKPTDQKTLVVSKDVGKVERSEVVVATPSQKQELGRRDTRTSKERQVSTATNDEPVVQKPKSEAQTLPKTLPVKQETPVFFTSNFHAMDVSSFNEGSSWRDGGPQASIDAADSRKEITPAKIDAFARPVVHQLSHAAKSIGNGSIELKLAPEELGKVRLSLTPGETNVTVQIIAERPETLDLIRRNLDLFTQSLKQEGFTNLSFSFGSSGGEQKASDDTDASFEFSDESSSGKRIETARQTPQTLTTGHLDIRI